MNPRLTIVVVGVALAVAAGTIAAVVLTSSSSAAAPSPSGPLSVYSHAGAAGVPSSGSPEGSVSVYSHAGTVGEGGHGGPPVGTVSIFSHAGTVTSGPTTTTPSATVRENSTVYVFVGFVNDEIGGGGITSVTDSLGDAYALVATTADQENHTENLYASAPIAENTNLSVSVTFAGGDTGQGGAVAFADILGSGGVPTVDAAAANSGPSGRGAWAAVSTSYPDELLLFGVSGQMKDTPFVAGPGETLLDMGNNTSGPFEDGEGFATYNASEIGTHANLSATLANSAVWNAIVVGVYASTTGGAPGLVTTPSVPVREGSVVCVFVGFVNPLIGGGYLTSITDTLNDTYTLISTTNDVENHTEELFVAYGVAENASLEVYIQFTGGATVMGGSVAVVDLVASSGVPTVNAIANNSGPSGTNAYVSFPTPYSNELLLFGVSGQMKDTPFTPGAGERLLSTGNNTSGPFEDGEGFATFSASEAGANANLSATLANSAVWNAIGVGLVAADTLGPPGTVSAPPIPVLANSDLCVFVGFVNPLIGGAAEVEVTDSQGTGFNLVATTGESVNHTEGLYLATLGAPSPSFNVTVRFIGGATPTGGSVAVVDVVGSGGVITLDHSANASGPAGLTASVNLTTAHTKDLFLLGVSGQMKDAPFAPTADESLLNTGSNTSGPYEDGEGFGTFSVVENGTTAMLSASLAHSAVWNAIAVAFYTPPNVSTSAGTATLLTSAATVTTGAVVAAGTLLRRRG